MTITETTSVSTGTRYTPGPCTPLDLTPIQPTLQKLYGVRDELEGFLIEREEAIRAALIALLARQHLFLLGPFGTAKSLLVRELVKRFCSPAGGGLRLFTKLVSPGTKPEELFGPPSLPLLKEGKYSFAIKHMLPDVEVAFLDELFNAGPFLHAPLLSITDMRIFENPECINVPLISLFAASNLVPRPDTVASRALWDRITIRVEVSRVHDSNFITMLQLGSVPAPQVTVSKTELEELQQVAARIPIPQSVYEKMLELRQELRDSKGLDISERRWMSARQIMGAHAVWRGSGLVEEDDLIIFQWMWDDPGQQSDIRRIVARLSNPTKAQALSLGDQADGVYQEAMKAQHHGTLDDDAKGTIAFTAARTLRTIERQIVQLLEDAQAEGRSVVGIKPIAEEVKRKRMKLASLSLGDLSKHE